MPAYGVHYELAFESFLQNRHYKYVSVDQTKRAMIAGADLKSFDFIIYPPDGASLLLDVKGRKLSYDHWRKGKLGESWATSRDVESMGQWREVFGDNFRAAFVFAYWLFDMPEQMPFMTEDDLYYFQGRHYVFAVTDLDQYRLRMKQRSPRWDTVYVPVAGFNSVTEPFEKYFNKG